MNDLSLDVHVLYLPDSKVEHVHRCIASLERAIEKVDYPINIHLVEGVVNHLGQSRKRGYSQGCAPYVTHVDYDDEVMEDVFVEIKPLLDGIHNVTTGEQVVDTVTGKVTNTPASRHHLAVYLRKEVESRPYEKLVLMADRYLMLNTTSTHLSKCLYRYYIYPDSHSRIQGRSMPHVLKEEKRMLRDPRLLMEV